MTIPSFVSEERKILIYEKIHFFNFMVAIKAWPSIDLIMSGEMHLSDL